MKKIMLTIGSLLFVCALTASAQQDTTRKQQTEEQQKYQQPPQTQQPQTQTQEQSNNLRDLTKVKSAEIPDALRSTLQAPEYKAGMLPLATFIRTKQETYIQLKSLTLITSGWFTISTKTVSSSRIIDAHHNSTAKGRDLPGFL